MKPLQEIEDKALRLPKKERAHLVRDLIQSLDSQTDSNSPDDFETIIQQRVQRIKSNRAFGISAEDVFARIEERYT